MKRVPALLLAASSLLALGSPARAELSYSYFELNGVPVLDNTLQDPVAESDVDLDGWRIGGVLSMALHRYWHVLLGADNERQKSANFLGLDRVGVRNDLRADRTIAYLAPHFNYRVYDGDGDRPQVDVFAGLGVQYARVEEKLTVGNQRQRDTDTEFGLLVRAGTRALVWRGLELHGDFSGSNIGITRNELFFNLGARYHLLADTADIGIGVGIGTDDFIGLTLSGRLYYGAIWRRLVRP